jgi:ribosomal protein S17E
MLGGMKNKNNFISSYRNFISSDFSENKNIIYKRIILTEKTDPNNIDTIIFRMRKLLVLGII